MKAIGRKICSLSLLTMLTSFPNGFALAESPEEFFKKFQSNPAQMMDRLPPYVEADGSVVQRGFIDFKKVEETFYEKKKLREQIISNKSPVPFAAPDGKNQIGNILDIANPVLTNAQEIEAKGLRRGQVAFEIWSDTYWPIYKGLTGIRYADRSFPDSDDWRVNYSYVMSRPASLARSLGSAFVDSLSPAEKYDLAMGDHEFTMTKFAWATGQYYVEKFGRVPKWMGYCHGWSGAVHMEAPLPTSPQTVVSPDGLPITFYPQDIKALQAMLWANASLETRFVGSRCDVLRPPKDPRGRTLDPGCFDINPSSWHLTMVNQVGVTQRSFVMDSTYDAEVWNFPVKSYSYQYIRMGTWKTAQNFRQAVVPISEYKLDFFSGFRPPEARYLVGVVMDVTYVVEISPTRSSNPSNPTKTLRLIYDLELDENFNIIGGEWYSNAHPDFSWRYDQGVQAMAKQDASLIGENWKSYMQVPTHWAEAASNASRRGIPLYSFIKGFLSDEPPLP